MRARRMTDQAPEGHFSSADHALAAGVLLGQLHKAMADGHGDALGISHVQPFMDAEGNYTNQMLVRIGSHSYTVTIDEAVSEAMQA